MKKPMPWFRFYTEVLDDPKVQRLPPHLFKTWVNLLCLAGATDGVFPTIDDISFRLRMSTHDVEQQLDELILAGLIDIKPDGKLTPHNWSSRQFVSDNSTERVRKHRKQKAETSRNEDETLHETPPEPEPNPETESETENLTSEQDAAREKRQATTSFARVGLGKGGEVSVEARRSVATKLGIGDADPLVAIYHDWSGSKTAIDPDALFASQAAKFYRAAEPEVREACQPLVRAAPVAPAVPTPRASSALVASLRGHR